MNNLKIARYKREQKFLQAIYRDSTRGLWFTLRYLLFDWPDTTPKILLKLLSLLFAPIYFAIAIFQTAIEILGIVINYIPILRFLMAFISITIIGNLIIMPLTFVVTFYDADDYNRKLRLFTLLGDCKSGRLL